MHWRKLSAAKKHTYKANSRAAHASMSKDEHDAWKAARRVKDRARRAETCFLEEDAERDAQQTLHANATVSVAWSQLQDVKHRVHVYSSKTSQFTLLFRSIMLCYRYIDHSTHSAVPSTRFSLRSDASASAPFEPPYARCFV